jgi:hypothetical protein
VTYSRLTPLEPLPQVRARVAVAAAAAASGSGTSASVPLLVTAPWDPPGTTPAAHVYTDVPERASFNLIHTMSASFLPSGIVNPRLVVRNKRGEMLAEFPSSAILSDIPVSTWLEWAEPGLTLESVNIQPWIRGGDPAYSPRFRSSGVVLLLRVTYSNLRLWEFPTPGIGSPLAELIVERLPTAWGYLGTSVAADPILGPVAIDRVGVRLQFVFGGSVGSASLFTIVLRLIEATVLLQLANVVTDAVARWVLHRKGYRLGWVDHVTVGDLNAAGQRARAEAEEAAQEKVEDGGSGAACGEGGRSAARADQTCRASCWRRWRVAIAN